MEGATDRDTQEEARGKKPIEHVKKMIDKHTEVEISFVTVSHNRLAHRAVSLTRGWSRLARISRVSCIILV